MFDVHVYTCNDGILARVSVCAESLREAQTKLAEIMLGNSAYAGTVWHAGTRVAFAN